MRSASANSRETVMASQSRYMQYANRCLHLAEDAQSNGDRQMFLEMADAWTHVALVDRDVSKQTTLDAAATE
jgi:hypothetical protein